MSITEPQARAGTRGPSHLVAEPALVARERITVASVPNSHVYVRHIASSQGHRSPVTRLDDPSPDDPRRSAVETWWPPVMLQPQWLATSRYDLLHIHFGFDATDPRVLDEALRTAQERGAPVVYTAHDLRNPHHAESDLHDRQLDVMMRRADAVITLTEGAAREIKRRWGVEAVVLPHPHVVDFATMSSLHARRRPARDEFRVGLHIKSVRANMDPVAVLPVLEDTVAQLPGAVLQVNGHREVLDRDGARYDRELADHLRSAERQGRLDLHVHDFLDDDALWNYLASLDVSVLAYRFGTHSGWLEACRDLGTTVVAPSCGYYADQGPVLGYRMDENTFDAASLADAVRRAYEERPQWTVSVDERRRQRDEIAAAHDDLYRQLLA